MWNAYRQRHVDMEWPDSSTSFLPSIVKIHVIGKNAHESYAITRSSKETDIWPHSEEIISRNQSTDTKQSFYYSLIYFSIDS